MMPDPSSFSLPPEGRELPAPSWKALVVAFTGDHSDESNAAAFARVVNAFWAEVERHEAEARGLREALEEAARDLDDAAVWHERSVHFRERAAAARAALSASPGSDSAIDSRQQSDPCSDCDGTGIGGHGGTCPTCAGSRVAPVEHADLDELKFGPRAYTPEQAAVIMRATAERAAPVAVPEQEEERVERLARLDRFLEAVHPTEPASSSSSSEEGKRAARAWTLVGARGGSVWVSAGPTLDHDATVIAVDGADLLAWLRERLTSDEAVEAWQSATPISMSTEGVRRCLAAVADCVGNRTEGGRHG